MRRKNSSSGNTKPICIYYQQRAVALAKIIAKSPDIILADEPTGSLDERNRSYVMDILKELNRQGKTIVVVTHDPYVSDCATRHIAL